jgi:PII-like signaling protein
LGALPLVGKSRKGLTFESFTHSMELPRDALLLRIFLGEADELGGEPVYQKIVLKAREMNLAGATVLRGPLGFGRSSHLHATATFRVSKDLPIVIEIVDSEEKIQEFLLAVEAIVGAGLITMEKVQAIFYKASPQRARGR